MAASPFGHSCGKKLMKHIFLRRQKNFSSCAAAITFVLSSMTTWTSHLQWMQTEYTSARARWKPWMSAKLGPDKIIGVSAQTVEQAILAERHGADYLGVGAVFPTGSRMMWGLAARARRRKRLLRRGVCDPGHRNRRYHQRKCR